MFTGDLQPVDEAARLADLLHKANPVVTSFPHDTVPDGLGGAYSGAHFPPAGIDGFGPGDYSGGYTGEGHSIYWGAFGDDAHSSASNASTGAGGILPLHYGPGGIVQSVIGGSDVATAGSVVSSTGDTILLPGSVATTGGDGSVIVPTWDNPAPGVGPDLPGLPGDAGSAGTGSTGTGSVGGITEIVTDTAGSEVFSRAGKGAYIPAGADTVSTSGSLRGAAAHAARVAARQAERSATRIAKIRALPDPPTHKFAKQHDFGDVDDKLTGDDIYGGESAKGGAGGSIEMQALGKSQSAETIFKKYYSPDIEFDATNMISREFGVIDLVAANSPEFAELREALQKEYFKSDYYDGDADSYVHVEGTDDVVAGGAEADAAGSDGTHFYAEDKASVAGDIMDQGITPFEAPAYEPITGADGAPIMLGDMPTGSEPFSWDMLNVEDIAGDSALSGALMEGLSSSDSVRLGASGIGSELGAVGQFLKNRAVDMIAGSALMPLFSWLDNATGSPWLSRTAQGTLALYGAVAGGDPFGLIAAPITWGIQEYIKQRQRLIDNKDPEAQRGKKFGYVREGGKWYPAIQTSRERDEGWIGSNKTQVSFAYGTEIKWRKNKMNEWIPYFEKGQYGMKNFHVGDEEVDDPTTRAGESYQKRADPLRDFYYLSEEDTRLYLHNLMGGDVVRDRADGYVFSAEEQAAIQAAQKKAFSDFGNKVIDDVSWNDWWAANAPEEEASEYRGIGAYVDQLQDIRQSLEFMQSYRYSEPGTVHNSDFTMDEFEGSREFRNIVNAHGRLGNPVYDSKAKTCNPGMGCVVTGYQTMNPRLYGRQESDDGTTWNSGDGAPGFKDSEEMRWLSDEYYRQLDLLYKAQKAAGNSMNFKKLYGSKADPAAKRYFRDPDGTWRANNVSDYRGMQTGVTDGLADNAWSLYQDGTWSFGELDTTEELKAAMEKIEASGEGSHSGTEHYRNSQQRNYLAQKAYTRYIFSKINKLGGYDYMFGYGEKGDDRYRMNDKDRYGGDYSLYPDDGISLDPLYSERDDHGVFTYGVDDLVHRGDYVTPEFITRADLLAQKDEETRESLRRAGVLTAAADTSNPDYVAGNFKTEGDYLHFKGGTDQVFDPIAGAWVAVEDLSPGLVLNPLTGGYELPGKYAAGGADTDKDGTVVGKTGEGSYDFGDTSVIGDGPVTDYQADYPAPGIDYPEGFSYNEVTGLVHGGKRPYDFYSEKDEMWNDFWDAQAAKKAAAEDKADADRRRQAAEDKAAADKAAEDKAAADAAKAAADAAKAAADAARVTTKTVPDAHDAPTTEDRPVYHSYQTHQREVRHFAPDATAPPHIPINIATKVV